MKDQISGRDLSGPKKNEVLKKNLLTILSILMPLWLFAGDFQDSLFHHASLVVTGRIESSQFLFIEDLGTEIHQIRLENQKIYKLDCPIPAETGPFLVTVSNLDFPAINQPDGQWQQPYQAGKWIIFLRADHLNGKAGQLRPYQLVPWTPELEVRLKNLAESEIIDLRPPPTPKNPPCSFCKAAEAGEWKQVERIVRRKLRALKTIKRAERGKKFNEWLLVKPCVTKIVPPMAILSSLPSWSSDYVGLRLNGQAQGIYLTFQIGRVYRLFWLSLGSTLNYYHLTSLTFGDDPEPLYASSDRMNTLSVLLDTAASRNYPPTYIPPDSVFRAAQKQKPDDFWTLNCTYLKPEQWHTTIQNLTAQKQVISLCLATAHCSQEIRTEAVVALREINDPKAIPYLLNLAVHTANHPAELPEYIPQYEIFCRELIHTLDSLTGCKVGQSNEQISLTDRLLQGNAIWKSKVIW
ncbi:MAG: hypothetical protein H6581_14210 [Bacteroidia bacterium]|nr:hypothetical protein [Bacteroidia bacterium]